MHKPKQNPNSLEQMAVGIGLYVNVNKTDVMCFKQKGTISTVNSKPLIFVDQFTYIGSNISSTENDVETIDKLLII